ncbi:Uncharacterised protein [Clostridium sporogenes]|nr:Uncharacterised protein [Clostridium sporogenes]
MNIIKYLNLVFKTTEDSTSTIKIPKVKERGCDRRGNKKLW